MKTAVLPLLLLTALSCAPFASLASEGDSAREACTEFKDARSTMVLPSRWTLIKDVIRLEFFPGSLVHLAQTPVAVADEHRVQPGASSSIELPAVSTGNVIFSIDPPADYAQSADVAAKRRRYAELSRWLTRQIPALRSLFLAPSVDQCVERALGMHFDFDQFAKLAQERNSLQIVEQLAEARTADRVIGKGLHKTYLRWQVVHSTDLMAVHQWLQAPGLRNIVILSHGMSDGKLVDSRLSEYPLGFFSDLSPSIRSISIFACHGTEIAKTYALAKELATGRSEHAQRLLFVSKGTNLSGLGELVPIKAFPSFIRRVDRSLAYEADRSLQGPVEIPPGTCSLQVSSFQVTRGTFAFVLNGRFIGSINSGNSANAGPTEVSFSYPCSFADRPRNILTIHGLSLLAPAQLESTDFQLVPRDPERQVVSSQLSHYRRADQSYQGSKFEFEFNRLN